ncbi:MULTISPECIES: hypothetical protein [Desulfococcus]|jgi:hypothetical protein|uniref:Uncharacterized protein n=1 Tax=Desulfococcus multivorans DSM 2059 TaxID=1121405 RepID=S7U135_DESML|nr:hypothetical protein [Desulfococcus multivorans]AOY60392.1 uncharacterized protein Dmul_36230 [Desulfococcus multivorans]AQV02491.1 hypothetical protein B2D07_18100 [Desulfococcus multivorans]EPR43062.1 hypothetical protein dsmv_1383 [Desulfococcus multivorans DSM 2059]MDX9817818.1 hypothetical protein [Desulfococcus multivorans]SJZ60496.1 hypothetical protein SAMN02745446_01090 [Desulfococcus multivorans DSM 2059]
MRIDATEIEDFKDIIRDAGLDPSDFELLEEEVHLPRPARASETFRAVVRNRRTGVTRTYNVLHWVVDFADDLRDRAFD